MFLARLALRNKCPHFDRVSTCFIAGWGELTRVEALKNRRVSAFWTGRFCCQCAQTFAPPASTYVWVRDD